MTLETLQALVREWTDHNFPYATSTEPLVGMMEELGEVSHAWLKLKQGIRTDQNHDLALKDGIGDMLIYMAHFCSLQGITLEECFQLAWDTVSKRDWIERPESG